MSSASSGITLQDDDGHRARVPPKYVVPARPSRADHGMTCADYAGSGSRARRSSALRGTARRAGCDAVAAQHADQPVRRSRRRASFAGPRRSPPASTAPCFPGPRRTSVFLLAVTGLRQGGAPAAHRRGGLHRIDAPLMDAGTLLRQRTARADPGARAGNAVPRWFPDVVRVGHHQLSLTYQGFTPKRGVHPGPNCQATSTRAKAPATSSATVWRRAGPRICRRRTVCGCPGPIDPADRTGTLGRAPYPA